jgi:stringent starvation protein B
MQPAPPKKDVAFALLEGSDMFVHLDPRAAGVDVPVGFRKQAQLVLHVGMSQPGPTPDLRCDDAGITCTLSFNRQRHFCVIPWSAVFALIGLDGRGMVWPESVPPEVQAHAARAKEEPAPAPAPAAAAAPPRLRAVPPPPASEPKLVEASQPTEDASAPKAKAKAAKPKAAKADKADKAAKPATAAKAAKPAKADKPAKAPKSTEKAAKPAKASKAAKAAPTETAEPAQKAPAAKAPRKEPEQLTLDVREPAPAAAAAPQAPPPPPRMVHPAPKPRPGAKPKRELPPYLRVIK